MRQRFLIEFSKDLGLEKNRLVGVAKNMSNPKKIAEKIITETGIDMSVFRGSHSRRDGLNYLIEEIGNHGVFVSTTSTHPKKKIPLTAMRGALLYSDKAPVIGINTTNESYGARIFTLLHEVTHIVTQNTPQKKNFEVTKIDFRNNDTTNPKERLCNKVAAYILIPDAELKKLAGRKFDSNMVKEVCIKLKVNSEPLLIRAHEYGLITQEEKKYLMKEIKERDWEEGSKAKKENSEKKAGADGGRLQLLKNGKNFFKAVVSIYTEGYITFTQALNVLNMNAKTFKKFSNNV